MAFKSSSQELAFYRQKILYFLINHSGEYTINDLTKMFGFRKRRIQDFISEYNQNGFEIIVRKGKICVEKVPEVYDSFNKLLLYQNMQKLAVLHEVKKYENGINRRLLYDIVSREKGIIWGNTTYHNIINFLAEEGLIYYDKSSNLIKPLNNITDNLNDDEILDLLMFLDVARFISSKPKTVEGIYNKIKLQAKKQGTYFNGKRIYSVNNRRVIIFDEMILKIIEEAILEEKALKIKYKGNRGDIIDLTVNPSGLIYLDYKDMWYLVVQNNRTSLYRLDKIIQVEVVEGSLSGFNKDLFEESFGVSSEELEDIIIRFDKEQFIYKKLIKYKAVHKSAEIIETEDSYILKDKVRGVLEIKRWIRGFGKSAYIIEPRRLREDIIKDLDLMIKRYGDING